MRLWELAGSERKEVTVPQIEVSEQQILDSLDRLSPKGRRAACTAARCVSPNVEMRPRAGPRPTRVPAQEPRRFPQSCKSQRCGDDGARPANAPRDRMPPAPSGMRISYWPNLSLASAWLQRHARSGSTCGFVIVCGRTPAPSGPPQPHANVWGVGCMQWLGVIYGVPRSSSFGHALAGSRCMGQLTSIIPRSISRQAADGPLDGCR